ncbi:MAG: GNAT family N-acetyltransferase [Deltaproteobacteria bacterium]
MVTIEAINSYEDFMRLEPLWDRLLEQSDMDMPFMTFTWFSFFWRKYCAACQPLVLVFKKNSEPVAIAPLMRRKIFWRRLPITNVSLMANYFSIRNGIICAPEADPGLLEPMFRFLKGSGFRFDLFCVDRIVKDSATDILLSTHIGTRSLKHSVMPAYTSPYIKIEGSWDDYLKGRSKHQRGNIRHVDKMYDQLEHSITTYTDERIEEAAGKMLEISRRSWKHLEGTAMTNEDERIDFYRAFMQLAAKEGWLRFKLLEIEGRPAAFLYALRYKDRLYLVEIYHSEEFKTFSPGIFLSHCMLKEAFDTGCTECEFLGKVEPWKQRLTSSAREHRKYWIFDNGPYGSLLHAWERGVVRAAKFVRRRAAPARAETRQGS